MRPKKGRGSLRLRHWFNPTGLVIAFLLFATGARGDVIFFPPYALLAYSGELIYSYEMMRHDDTGLGRWTTSLWAGIGTVGSFAALYDPPAAGAELAVEKRFYFKPGAYKHFFISGYAGIAYMGYLRSMNYIGFVPGLKINYKAHLSRSFILEPYLGISMPAPYDLEDHTIMIPFPVATIGLRIGFSSLKRRPAKKEKSLQG